MTQTTATESLRCSRCGRKLTSASSVAAGIGPRCSAIQAATEGLSVKQVDKMEQLITDQAIVSTNRKGVYKIVNEAGEHIHTVSVNGNCTCEWGTRRTSADTKVCYMVAAARLLATPRIRKAAPVLPPVALPASADIWAELADLGALDMVPAF